MSEKRYKLHWVEELDGNTQTVPVQSRKPQTKPYGVFVAVYMHAENSQFLLGLISSMPISHIRVQNFLVEHHGFVLGTDTFQVLHLTDQVDMDDPPF